MEKKRLDLFVIWNYFGVLYLWNGEHMMEVCFVCKGKLNRVI